MRHILRLAFYLAAICVVSGLRQSQYTRTSQGRLASGLDTLGGDLVSLREGINQDDRNAVNQVNADLSTSSVTITGALDLALENRLEELQTLRTRIEDIRHILNDAVATCGSRSSCGNCTSEPNCIWCVSSHTCMAGDNSGGVMEYCDVYEHGECSIGCEQYNVCASCVLQECGWCQASHQCLPLESDSNCQEEWITNLENVNCTVQGNTEVEEYEVRSNAKNTDLHSLWRELVTDQDEVEGLEREVRSLQDEDGRVGTGFRSITSQELDSLSISNSVAGIGPIVDSTALNQGNTHSRPRTTSAASLLWTGSRYPGHQHRTRNHK